MVDTPRNDLNPEENRAILLPEDQLADLFEKARDYPPTAEQATQMLRAVGWRPSRWSSPALRWAAGGLATAATVAAAVLILVSPNQPRAWALADVARNLRQAPVIKQIGPQYVCWYGDGRFTAYVTHDGKRATFIDLLANEIAEFDRDRGALGAVFLNTADPTNPATDQYESAPTHLDHFIDQAERRGRAFEDLWLREDAMESGVRAIKLTSRNDRNTYITVCTIDAATGMLIWSMGPDGRTTYEYPAIGPASIYDLGVPQDAKVIDARATPEMRALRDRVVAAQRVDYGPHLLVCLDTGEEDRPIVRYISDGSRYRVDAFPAADFDRSTHEHLADIAERLISTDIDDTRHAVRVFDGTRATCLSHYQDGSIAGRYVEDPDTAMSWLYSLRGVAWQSNTDVFFFLGQWSSQLMLLGPDEHGRVGKRILKQANNLDRPLQVDTWYDPAHGYLPCLTRRLSFPDAEWQLDPNWQKMCVEGSNAVVGLLPDAPAQGHVTEVLQWAELRPGVWYPALTHTRQVVRDPDGEWIDLTYSPYRDGHVAYGQVILSTNEPDDPADDREATTYAYVLALPLDHINDAWFDVPDWWLEYPLKE